MKNLFIVGAQRSGSSLLRDLLDQHESVSMARPFNPEPKYFLNKSPLDKDEYKSIYFQNISNDTIYLAEKSTSYFESKFAAENIYKNFPKSKILIILRSPAERTWSNYKFSKLNNIENLDFSEAIKPESENRKSSEFSVNPFAYVSRSKYENFLKIYQEIFSPEEIKILIFEEFIKDSSGSELFEWLGIDNKKINAEFKINSSNSEDLPISHKTQLQEEFSQTIQYVENLIGREINPWREL